MTLTLPVLLAAAAAWAGATLQRSTGMGFALVASPFMVLTLGPIDGIVVTNVAGAATSILTALQLRRDFDAARARWLIPAGMLGCVPGAVVVTVLPPAWVGVVVGVVVLVALIVTLLAPSGHVSDSGPVRVVTGLCSGFMNTSAGVGGPAIAVYTRSVGWERAPFAATATTIFAIQGLTAIALKHRWPAFPAAGWAALAAAIGIGMITGNILHGRLDDRSAMRAVMTLALLGTVVALGKAVWALVG